MSENLKRVCSKYCIGYCTHNGQAKPSLSAEDRGLPLGAIEGPDTNILLCTAVSVLTQQNCDQYQEGETLSLDGSLPKDNSNLW